MTLHRLLILFTSHVLEKQQLVLPTRTCCATWDKCGRPQRLFRAAKRCSFSSATNFLCRTLGSWLVFLVIGKTSLSHKSQEKELFADCKAVEFCDYKATISC